MGLTMSVWKVVTRFGNLFRRRQAPRETSHFTQLVVRMIMINWTIKYKASPYCGDSGYVISNFSHFQNERFNAEVMLAPKNPPK